MVNSFEAKKRTQRWIEEFVIGLNICPFAKHPFEKGLVEIIIYDGEDTLTLLETLATSMDQLDKTEPSIIETSILVAPNMLHDFEDYLSVLDLADAVLVDQKLEGIFQIASFHPQYQFAGSTKTALSNYTNRSPYPMFHLLREDSVFEAGQRHPDVESIPEINIQLLESMDDETVKGYLK